MKAIRITYLITIIYLIVLNVLLKADDNRIEIGIDEKLGSFLPGDAVFVTSDMDTVRLGEIIDKPVLLALVYFECSGICSPLLSDLGWVAQKVDLIPNKDFKVIALSFDYHETPEVSSRWKENYLKSLKGDFPSDAWIFLTGDSVNIKMVTDAAGFYFKPNEEQFVHAGTVIAVSPQRKISRYLFGTTFNPFDIKLALLEAQSGKTNPTISKVLQFCFSYDPEGRTYTLNVTRIAGTIMLLGVGLFLVILLKKRKVKAQRS